MHQTHSYKIYCLNRLTGNFYYVASKSSLGLAKSKVHSALKGLSAINACGVYIIVDTNEMSGSFRYYLFSSVIDVPGVHVFEDRSRWFGENTYKDPVYKSFYGFYGVDFEIEGAYDYYYVAKHHKREFFEYVYNNSFESLYAFRRDYVLEDIQ